MLVERSYNPDKAYSSRMGSKGQLEPCTQISWKGVLERAPRLYCYDTTHSCRARRPSPTFALSALLHPLSPHLEELGDLLVSGNKGTRMLRLPFQDE